MDCLHKITSPTMAVTSLYREVIFFFNSIMMTAAPSGCQLLRYDMSELWEMGRGVEMWAVEAAERNRSVLLRRVKTWPQLMCCALIYEPGVFIYRGERKREMKNQAEG